MISSGSCISVSYDWRNITCSGSSPSREDGGQFFGHNSYYHPPEKKRKKVYSPYNKCIFCGTRSKLENMHGNCIACGAPLPDKEFTYEYD